MANRERGELRLAAPDRSYRLRLIVEACCELEDRTNRELHQIVGGANEGRVTDLRWILWAGLQAEHADLFQTPEDVGALADRIGGIHMLRAYVVALIRVNEDDSPPDTTSTAPAAETPGSRWRRLYIDARRAGIAPDQFWRLSLRELWRELASQRDAQRQAIERDRTVAWMTAALSRSKTLPPLDRFIGRRMPAQTPDQMRGMLAILRATYPHSRHTKKGNDARRQRQREAERN